MRVFSGMVSLPARLELPSLGLLSLGLLVSSLVLGGLAAGCGSSDGDSRLARQAALGMTIEHQALRFADRLLYDSIDCTGTAEDNAASIATAVSGNLGSCAEVTQRGAEVDVVTGASCDFGEHAFASLETHVALSREGDALVVSIELPRGRINGLDTVGNVTLRSADCAAFEATMDLASTEYTIATPAGTSLRFDLMPERATVTGALEVVALNAPAGARELVVEHEAMVFGAGQCWPEAGVIRGRREPALVTITFDASTTLAGTATITPTIGGTSAYALPEYGPCPDTDPRP